MKKIILTFLTMVMLSVSATAYTVESYTDIMAKAILSSKVVFYVDMSVRHLMIDTLQKGDTYVQTLYFDANTEYRIVGMGGDGISDLDIAVFSEAGVEIAKDNKTDNAPEVTFKLFQSQTCKIQTTVYNTLAGQEREQNLFFVIVAVKK